MDDKPTIRPRTRTAFVGIYHGRGRPSRSQVFTLELFPSGRHFRVGDNRTGTRKSSSLHGSMSALPYYHHLTGVQMSDMATMLKCHNFAFPTNGRRPTSCRVPLLMIEGCQQTWNRLGITGPTPETSIAGQCFPDVVHGPADAALCSVGVARLYRKSRQGAYYQSPPFRLPPTSSLARFSHQISDAHHVAIFRDCACNRGFVRVVEDASRKMDESVGRAYR